MVTPQGSADLPPYPVLGQPVAVAVGGSGPFVAALITAIDNTNPDAPTVQVTAFPPGGKAVECFSGLQHCAISAAPCWYSNLPPG